MNTSLFLLRAIQVGLSLEDLDNLEFGQVIDLIVESGNDHENYAEVATQEDFDAF